MYYSLDDIETDGLRVPTRFLVDAPQLGFLMPAGTRNEAPDPTVRAGTEVVLPLWLATPLAAESLSEDSDEPILELLEPAALRTDVLNVLKSEPLALDLRSQNRLFTNLALRWSELFTSDELARILQETVRVRAASIFDMALAQQGGEHMDEYEQRLYAQAAATIRDIRAWQRKN